MYRNGATHEAIATLHAILLSDDDILRDTLSYAGTETGAIYASDLSPKEGIGRV